MNSHIWTKQAAPFLDGSKYLNQINTANPQGVIQSVPSGVQTSQGEQNIPGDAFFFDADAALALSDTVNIGTLYEGFYKFVQTKAGSTAAPARGKLCFWDSAVNDDLMQVTPDESGTTGTGLLAGVYLNAPTKGNWCFIQVGGKCSIKFRTAITGTATAGAAVYAAAAGAGADVGTADQLVGVATAVTQGSLGPFLQNFIGTAQALPVAGAISTVSIKHILTYRW